MKAGKASVVTDHIEKFDAAGIQLKSGKHLDADIIITATGLKLAVAGKIPVRVDGAPVDWHDHYYYKACMFSNVPNFSAVFGYLNASWTLRADVVSEYVRRVLNHLRDTGTTRTEAHTSELQLMRRSYAVCCPKIKNHTSQP